MAKLVVFNLGKGDFTRGFSVTIQIGEEGDRASTEILGQLPPNLEVPRDYAAWQSSYSQVQFQSRLGGPKGQSSNYSQPELLQNLDKCRQLSQRLSLSINKWLNADTFRPVKEKLLNKLEAEEEIRLAIQTGDPRLRQLPWHLWDFFDSYPKAEATLSAPEYDRARKNDSGRREIGILAILGNSQGIDVAADRAFLEQLPGAEVTFLVEPERQEINDKLWEQSWEILFFAGHSRSEGESGRIFINSKESLTLGELKSGLAKAVEGGLQLGIFNSCDGLGLARELEDLHVPQVVVMREPVPDRVAQQFLKHFLRAFAAGYSLYLAARQARERLSGQGLEEQLPGCTWLPVICQNPAEVPLRWSQLGGISPCPYRGLAAFRQEDAEFFFGREAFVEQLVAAVHKKPLVAAIGPSGSGKSSTIFAGLIPQLQQKTDLPWQIVSFRPGNRPFEALAAAIVDLKEGGRLTPKGAATQTKPNGASDRKSNVGDLHRNKVPVQERSLTPTVRAERSRSPIVPNSYNGDLPNSDLAGGRLTPKGAATQTKPNGASDRNNETVPRDFANTDLAKLAIELQEDEGTLYKEVEAIVQNGEGSRLLLVADQFEELYTLCSAAERQVFLDGLLKAVREAPGFTLVLTMRADFLGRALSYEPFGKALRHYPPELLIPMERSELERAIALPAKKQGVQLEEGLTKRIIDDLGNAPGYLPLLEFALTQMWEKQTRGILAYGTYEKIGGVKEALANYADKVYIQLDEDDRRRAQRVFVQLVRPGEGTEDTRRLATREEVGEKNWDLVMYLASERLVVTGYRQGAARGYPGEQGRQRGRGAGEQRGRGGTASSASSAFSAPLLSPRVNNREEIVEIVHEALIRNWKELIKWMQEDRDFRSWQEQLRGAMRLWERSDRDEGALLRGVPLGAAEDWLQQRPADLSQAEQDFIRESAELQEKEIKKEKRRQRQVVSALAGGLIGALTLAGAAAWQWQNGLRSEIKALALTSEAFYKSGRQLEALKIAVTAGKQLGNLFAIDDEVRVPVAAALAQATRTETINYLEGHTDEVTGIVFSADGEYILTGSKDKTAILWRRNGEKLAVLEGHEEALTNVAFSPDGRILATASEDKTIKLWHLDGKLIATLAEHTDKITGLSFSPDGRTLASASADETTKLWKLEEVCLGDVETKHPALSYECFGSTTLEGHEDEVTDLAFSPDGKMLASSSADKMVKLWNLDSGQEVDTLKHRSSVFGVGFRPDGQSIVSLSKANFGKTEFRVWTKEGALLNLFVRDSDGKPVKSVFSPDGKTIAIISGAYYHSGNSAQMWSFDRDLTGIWSEYGMTSIGFAPQADVVALARRNNVVEIIQFKKRDLEIRKSHNFNAVKTAKLSVDGKAMVSAVYSSDIQVARLLNVDGKLLKTFKQHGYEVVSPGFSPDSQSIAWASNITAVELWQHYGTLLQTIEGYGEGAIFSPDRQTIARIMPDNSVQLWGQNGTLLYSLEKQDDRAKKVIFSPDSQTLATIHVDNTVKLWQRNGALLASISGKQAVFSPDGQLLAVFGENDTVQLWQTDGKFIAPLKGRQVTVKRVVFSPTSETLVALGVDNTIQLWHREGNLLKTIDDSNPSRLHIKFSPDGQLFALAAFMEDDRTMSVQVWQTDGNRLEELKIDNVFFWRDVDFAFSPDSHTLAAYNFNQVVMWRRQGVKTDTQSGLRGIDKMVFSSNGKTIILRDQRETEEKIIHEIEFCQTNSKCVKRVEGRHVAFSDDRQHLALVTEENKVQLWQTDGTRVATIPGITAFFSDDSQTLAVITEKKEVQLWQTDGTFIETVPNLRISSPDDRDSPDYRNWLDRLEIRFMPNSDILAVTDRAHVVQIWHPDTMSVKTFYGHSDEVNSVTFSPDGQILASASNDKTIKLWNPDSGEVIATLEGHSEGVNSVAFSPDGRILASASNDKTIKLWNPDSGELITTLEGHHAEVNSVVFSPDGETIASASEDATVTLWNRDPACTASGQDAKKAPSCFALTTLKGHGSSVTSIAFSPDGRLVASADYSTDTVNLWSRDGTLLATLDDFGNSGQVLFTPDGRLAAPGRFGQILIRSLELDELLQEGCAQLRDYLQTNPNVEESERGLCGNG